MTTGNSRVHCQTICASFGNFWATMQVFSLQGFSLRCKKNNNNNDTLLSNGFIV